jgi:outer membrane receptor protein involved in Fe transport
LRDEEMAYRSLLTAPALVLFGVSALVVGSSSHARADEQGESGDAPPPAAESAAPPAETTETAGAPAEPDATATARDEAQATTHVASFAATKLKDSPAVVTVVSGEDIRSTGARDLIDILYLVPGYFMGVDTEGVVGPGFRGLWGHEGKILLMIDGKEMNELLFSNMQLGNEFPVELIERVEVVRGPGSVIYGGSAELSVINIVTRGLQGATDLKVTGTYGQMTGASQFGNGYGRRKLTVSGRLVVDGVPGLSMFASVSLGQGQRSVRPFTDTNIDPGPATTVTTEGQSALNPGIVQAGIAFRDFQASILYSHLGTTSVASPGGPVTEPPVDVNFDAFHAEVIGAVRPNARFEIVPRFNFTYQRPWHASNPAAYFYDKSVRRLRGRLLARMAPIDELQITVGGDAMFDHAELLGDPNGGYETPFAGANAISYQTLGAFVELFSENPIVNVAAGARYDNLSSVGDALVPRLVLLRNIGPIGLKGLYSRAFRAPGIENINSGVNLRPERTRIFEFELAVDLTPEQRLAANVFDMLIDAPIAYSFDPSTGMVGSDQYRNLGQQGTRGFEIAYRLRTPVARGEANYSFYVPSAAVNTFPYTVPGHSDQFFGAPAHRASLRATFGPFEGFGISPTLIVLGPRYQRGPGDMTNLTAIQIPTQVLANLFIYKENFGVRGLTAGLGFYNIFGTDYHFIHATASSSYAAESAPMPGLDREVLLRFSYYLDPSEHVPASSLASNRH